MIATQPKSRQILGINQQAYQSLRASMSLNLRRQLLIAVCDSVVLQNQLASQLEQDLAEKSWLATQARGSSSSLALTNSGTPLSISLRLERLTFDSEDAHLPRQVAHWVRQATLSGSTILPQVQMLGIEQMTRQPAIIQNHFLRSLEQIEALLPRLNTSLLVWVPWPWLRTIQSSSPNFWKWRNGVFEFVSDPTPTVPSPVSSSALENNLDANRFAEEVSRLANGARENSRIDRHVNNSPDNQPVVARDDAAVNGTADSAYPTIDATHQVVALYGETDDSDFGDYDQPTLETVAIWDTVDVDATPVDSPEEVELESHGYTHQALAKQGPEDQAPENQAPKDQAFTEQMLEGLSPEDQASEEDDISLQWGQLRSTHHQPAPDEQTHTTNQTTDQATDEQSLAESVQAEEDQPPLAAESSVESAIEVASKAHRQRAADDYFEIGRGYRNRIEAGERGLSTIEPAIAAYEGGLRCLSGPHPDWGSGLNDLGTLYWLKAQQLNDAQQIVDCMNHSIELYAEALTKIEPDHEHDMACQLHSNMGAVYSMLATMVEPVYYFQQAAEAYTQALPLCSLAENPDEYATLHNSLGSVYWKLSHYAQAPEQVQESLRQAIVAYQQALSGYQAEERPLDYAAVQNNLGITYWSLAKYIESDADSVTTLKHAIASYREALSYRTPDSDPAACAITYNNLALAYWDLSKDETTGEITTEKTIDSEARLRYQRNAVTAFEAALQTSAAVGSLSQMDRAAIYHCLGDVHAQMVDNAPSQAEIASSLQKSLHSYVQAIDGMPTASPVYEARLNAIVANLRSHRQHLGLASQQAALNRVPSELVSEVMQAL
ncbi:MAG: hypothetical protein AAGJ69_00255 [Cyanobacteria bacterium J06559_1]